MFKAKKIFILVFFQIFCIVIISSFLLIYNNKTSTNKIYQLYSSMLTMYSNLVENQANKANDLSFSILSNQTIQSDLHQLNNLDKDKIQDQFQILNFKKQISNYLFASKSLPFVDRIDIVLPTKEIISSNGLKLTNPFNTYVNYESSKLTDGSIFWITNKKNDYVILSRAIRSTYPYENFDYLATMYITLDMKKLTEQVYMNKYSEYINIFINYKNSPIYAKSNIDFNKIENNIKNKNIKINNLKYILAESHKINTGWDYYLLAPYNKIYVDNNSLIYFFIIVIVILYFNIIRTITNDNLKKQILIKETQLRALQNQINPHFLYNSLDTINWMAISKEQYEIANVIKSIALLLRSSINYNDTFVDLIDEIELINNYIYIQKTRFGDRLNFMLEIQEEYNRVKIPKLIIQPLVENSIKYNVEMYEKPCLVSIVTWTDDSNSNLYIAVTDDGAGIEDSLIEGILNGNIKTDGNGIGIYNIIKRLNVIYGKENLLTIKNNGGFTQVTIQIPLNLTTR